MENYSHKNILQKEEKMVLRYQKLLVRFRLDLSFLCVLVVLVLIITASVYMVGLVQEVIHSIPGVSKKDILYHTEVARLYDQKGNEFYVTERKPESSYVSLGKISDAAKNAFLAADAPNFYQHQGMNIRGLLVALSGRGDSDSSSGNGFRRTLAQKLVREQLFYNELPGSFRTNMVHNIREQYLAGKLETELGKDRILEYYLNTLYFGGNLVGIGAASDYYFKKEPWELTISEAAVLAALSRDPDRYDPREMQEANSSQRSEILSDMLDQRLVTEDEYEDALGDNVYQTIQSVRIKKETYGFDDEYASAVLSHVVSDLKTYKGYSATQAYNAVYHGGARIYTCLDGEVQSLCEEEVLKQYQEMKGIKKPQMSFVLIEQSTGKVRALLGAQYKEDRLLGTKNSTTMLMRQPGEVLPVLSVWLPAIDTGGMTLGSVEDDSIYDYDTGDGVQRVTDPMNEYQGLVTMRESILKRLGSPAVKTLECLGIQTGFDYLKKLGITTLVEQEKDVDGNIMTDNDLFLAYGILERGVTNLELTSAYTVLSNQGKMVTPQFYTKMVDCSGRNVITNQTHQTQLIKKSSAWLLTNVLSEYIQNKNGGKINASGSVISAAGMEGRSEKRNDVWFEGYTPNYTAGLWYGMMQDDTVDDAIHLQKIWQRIMQRIYSIQENLQEDFEKPGDIQPYTICSKCGKLAVDGLCGEAIGGSTIRREYFVVGTQPVKPCDCHVKYRICKKSGKPAGTYCPSSEVEERVYLIKSEESKTKDSPNVLPKGFVKKRCDVHAKK